MVRSMIKKSIKRANLKTLIKRKKVKKIPLAVRKSNDNSKYWRAKADKAWGTYIHTKYDCCLICGRASGKLDAHHIISKGQSSLLRHEPKNGVLLCVQHHTFNEKFSAHRTPKEFKIEMFILHREKMEFLYHGRYRTGKHNYREAFEKLNSLIEGIE